MHLYVICALRDAIVEFNRALNVSEPTPPPVLPYLAPFLPPQAQLAGTVIGIVMSIVLLCKFTKCVYTAAAVLYTIGFISDALNAVFW